MHFDELRSFLHGKPAGIVNWLDEEPHSRLGVACSILVFIIPLALYCSTCMREPAGFADYVGMLIAAKVWGIPHPPGFPLYLILIGIVSAVPTGNQVFNVALLSALAASLSVHFIYRIAKQLGFGTLIAASASLLAATSRPVWMQGVITDVYSLNLLFLLVTIWSLFRWKSTTDYRWLYLAIWVIIVGTANYPALAITLPGFILFALLTKPSAFFDKKFWLHTSGAFAFSILLYSYIFLRSMAEPVFSVEWIDGDASRFWHYISCQQYRHFFGIRPDYTSSLWSMFVGIGILTLTKPGWFASFLGIYTLTGSARAKAIPLILTPIAFFIQAFFYHSHEAESRLSPIYPFAILLAVSFSVWFINRVTSYLSTPGKNNSAWLSHLRPVLYSLLIISILAGSFVHIRQNLDDLNFATPCPKYRKACRITDCVEKPCILVVRDYEEAICYVYCMVDNPEFNLNHRPFITEDHPEIKPCAVMYPWNSSQVTEALELGCNLYVIDRYQHSFEEYFNFTLIDTGIDSRELFKVTLKQ